MKTIRMAALCMLGLFAAGPSAAQAFGQFTGAEVLPVNGHLFGAYVQSSSSVAGLLAQLRLSFYPGIDFGFQGGLARQDYVGGSKTTVRLGTDVRVLAMRPTESMPISVAVGGMLGVETGDRFNILSLGPTAQASRSFPLGQNGQITPYVGVGLTFTNIDVGPTKDNQVSVPLRIGGDFRATPSLRLALELQIELANSFNDDLGLAGGVNVPF